MREELTPTEMNLLTRAENAIGHNPADEIELNPQLHAERLENSPDARPLYRVLLRDPRVAATIAAYPRHDTSAGTNQSSFKKSRNIILLLVMAAVIVGSGRLFLGSIAWIERISQISITILVYFCLLLSVAYAWKLRKKKYLENWLRSRATAEFLRNQLFDNVMFADAIPAEPGEDEASALPLLLLKMEYFRRYQFELQSAYHNQRQAHHSFPFKFVEIMLYVLTVLVVIWLFATITHIAAALDDNVLTLPAGSYLFFGHQSQFLGLFDNFSLWLAVSAGAIFSAVFVYTQYNDSLRNATRHTVAQANFEFLKPELERARIAAVRGDELKVLAFVRRVHSIMSAEHADWVRLQDLASGNAAAAGTFPGADPKGTTG